MRNVSDSGDRMIDNNDHLSGNAICRDFLSELWPLLPAGYIMTTADDSLTALVLFVWEGLPRRGTRVAISVNNAIPTVAIYKSGSIPLLVRYSPDNVGKIAHCIAEAIVSFIGAASEHIIV